MNLNFTRHGKQFGSVKIPESLRLPVGILFVTLFAFVLFMFVYGAQWCGLWLVNAMFHTHIPMTFTAWFLITLVYLLLGVFKIEQSST